MRALIPGQVQWDDARTDFANDNYGGAALHTGLMLGEQVMTVLTFGSYQGSRATAQTALQVSERVAAEKAGEALAKGAGGFKYGMGVDEIVAVNASFGGRTAYRPVDTLLSNTERYPGFFDKTSSMIRDIAGGHLFDNGNKRTAVEIAERLISRNGVDGPPTKLIWNVVDRVATGQLKTVSEISKALREF